MQQVIIKKLPHYPKNLALPSKATLTAAAVDLYAALAATITLQPLERKLVPTGLSMILPPELSADIRPRSGLALKYGLTVLNTPGTIDSDYRGEVGVLVINLGQEPVTIEPASRIAQLLLLQPVPFQWQLVDEETWQELTDAEFKIHSDGTKTLNHPNKNQPLGQETFAQKKLEEKLGGKLRGTGGFGSTSNRPLS